MPRKKQRISYPENCCKLCLTTNDNEILYGKLVKTEAGNVHHFCILFACGLTQNGNDDEGCYGFLDDDIRNEIRRAKLLKCSFCKQNTVASACAVKKCQIKYHFNCGLMNDCLFNFFGCFPSYCVRHRKDLDKNNRTVDDSYRTVDPKSLCNICLEPLQSDDGERAASLEYQIMRTSCCSKFIHINCVKAQAHNAGIHHIKCPLCNNRDDFIKCAQHHGVYIPDRDATWEDPNVWRAQESRYARCDAEICRSMHSRDYNEENGDWEINVCVTCGSFGIHTACSSDLNDVDDQEEFEYECPDCQKVTKNKTESAITRNEPAITRNEPVITRNEPVITRNEPAITRNEPAITRSEPVITKNEPSIERNQPVIATCDPPSSPFNQLSSPPSVRFDDSNGSSNSTNKQEIELIEISDDEEDEEEIICVDDEDEEDMFKPFSGNSLTGQKSHTKGFNKYRSHCFSQN